MEHHNKDERSLSALFGDLAHETSALMQKEVELAKITIQRDIANAQAQILAEALKSANIDIVGGEQQFFDRIANVVSVGKSVDSLFENSSQLKELKQSLLGDGNGNGDFAGNLRKFISQFSVSSDDIKNLTISALIMKMMNQTSDNQKRGILNNLLDTANSLGISGSSVQALGINPTK